MGISTATEIIKQLGGAGRIKAMVGACNFGTNGNDVSFRFKGSKKANHIKITLNGMDLYDVEFIKIWGTNIKTVSKSNGLYCDMLKSEFETFTGLRLSL